MIYLGIDDNAKEHVVARYCAEHAINHVVVLSPIRFRPPLACSYEWIDWPEIIMYRHYYRLIQDIGRDTLVVINECQRTQNRHDLTYNCIRQFLNQTTHRLIFQYLPLIDTIDDFMVLFDFDTDSRWKREQFSVDLLKEATVQVAPVSLELNVIDIAVDAKTHDAYQHKKQSLFATVRNHIDTDPHIIPRNLVLLSGKAKLPHIDASQYYVGRGNRFKLPTLATYREVATDTPRAVFEFCHRFIDFRDFLTITRQRTVDVLVADTKADQWYLRRYQDWITRVRDGQTILRQQ